MFQLNFFLWKYVPNKTFGMNSPSVNHRPSDDSHTLHIWSSSICIFGLLYIFFLMRVIIQLTQNFVHMPNEYISWINRILSFDVYVGCCFCTRTHTNEISTVWLSAMPPNGVVHSSKMNAKIIVFWHLLSQLCIPSSTQQTHILISFANINMISWLAVKIIITHRVTKQCPVYCVK